MKNKLLLTLIIITYIPFSVGAKPDKRLEVPVLYLDNPAEKAPEKITQDALPRTDGKRFFYYIRPSSGAEITQYIGAGVAVLGSIVFESIGMAAKKAAELNKGAQAFCIIASCIGAGLWVGGEINKQTAYTLELFNRDQELINRDRKVKRATVKYPRLAEWQIDRALQTLHTTWLQNRVGHVVHQMDRNKQSELTDGLIDDLRLMLHQNSVVSVHQILTNAVVALESGRYEEILEFNLVFKPQNFPTTPLLRQVNPRLSQNSPASPAGLPSR